MSVLYIMMLSFVFLVQNNNSSDTTMQTMFGDIIHKHFSFLKEPSSVLDYLRVIDNCNPNEMCFCTKVQKLLSHIRFYASTLKYCGALYLGPSVLMSEYHWNIQLSISSDIHLEFHKISLPYSAKCRYIYISLHYDKTNHVFCGKHLPFSKNLQVSSAELKYINIYESSVFTEVFITYTAVTKGRYKTETCAETEIDLPLIRHCTFPNSLHFMKHSILIIAEPIQRIKVITKLYSLEQIVQFSLHDGPSSVSPLFKGISTAFVVYLVLWVKTGHDNLMDMVKFQYKPHNTNINENSQSCFPRKRYVRLRPKEHPDRPYEAENLKIRAKHQFHGPNTVCIWRYDDEFLRNEKLHIEQFTFHGPDIASNDFNDYLPCQYGGIYIYKYILPASKCHSEACKRQRAYKMRHSEVLSSHHYKRFPVIRIDRLREFGRFCENISDLRFYNFLESDLYNKRDEGLLIVVVWLGQISFGELKASFAGTDCYGTFAFSETGAKDHVWGYFSNTQHAVNLKHLQGPICMAIMLQSSAQAQFYNITEETVYGTFKKYIPMDSEVRILSNVCGFGHIKCPLYMTIGNRRINMKCSERLWIAITSLSIKHFRESSIVIAGINSGICQQRNHVFGSLEVRHNKYSFLTDYHDWMKRVNLIILNGVETYTVLLHRKHSYTYWLRVFFPFFRQRLNLLFIFSENYVDGAFELHATSIVSNKKRSVFTFQLFVMKRDDKIYEYTTMVKDTVYNLNLYLSNQTKLLLSVSSNKVGFYFTMETELKFSARKSTISHTHVEKTVEILHDQ